MIKRQFVIESSRADHLVSTNLCSINQKLLPELLFYFESFRKDFNLYEGRQHLPDYINVNMWINKIIELSEEGNLVLHYNFEKEFHNSNIYKEA